MGMVYRNAEFPNYVDSSDTVNKVGAQILCCQMNLCYHDIYKHSLKEGK
jgi:hypothetical protein